MSPKPDTVKHILLFYPPGRAYQRSEDRCQGNIENSAATNIHACNDLGYVAAGLRGLPYRVLIRDYPAEKKDVDDLMRDAAGFEPALVFVSITQATIFDDLEIIRLLKKRRPDLAVILKGALFFNAPMDLLNRLDLSGVDYLIGGESDFTGAKLIHRHFRGKKVGDLYGIVYRDSGQWVKTCFSRFEPNLDSLRFPDRRLMNNRMYIRPDTAEPQATITVGRGCPSKCIYCLTPMISGRQLRQRSPENVLSELRECYHRFGIRQFFFKSDTFTLDADWVKRLCHLIIQSELAGRIEWVANSRTRPIALDTLATMKDAGCWLVAFGFESGSPESLERMAKGATVEDSLRAAALARKAGLRIFGFFMAGFPWEGKAHLDATEKLIFAIDADFMEIHIPIPYAGTGLKQQCLDHGLDTGDALGRDYYASPVTGTRTLTRRQIQRFRKKVLFRYYFRPSYIARRLRDVAKKPVTLIQYTHYALRLLKNLA
jgi:anaerobic magnesium-protoporphyrin IX monomethyl ester cyclase